MSGTAGVPNSFAAAVTATGAQLDANYTTIVAYLNNPTNRNNYAADGAATNTVVISFSPPVVGGYSAGLEIAWKWGVTNTGAVMVNANGLGNANLVNPDGSALPAGQGIAGSIGKAVYDGTRFISITGFNVPASQAQVATATSAITFISPATAKYHPGVAKASGWVSGTATGTITSGAQGSLYGATVVKLGTGTFSVALSVAMASTQYVVLATSYGPSGGFGLAMERDGDRTTTGFSLQVVNASTAVVNPTGLQFAVYGSLP